MSLYEKQELLSNFNSCFRSVDQTMRSYDTKVAQLAELSSATLMLNSFLKRYESVLDETEKEILRDRIESGVDMLLKVKEKHMWALWYFGRNYGSSPELSEIRARSLLVTARGIFELAPITRIPLDSTLWNYFIDQILDFARDFSKIYQNADGQEKGKLTFLLAITIHSLSTILRVLEDDKSPKDVRITSKINKLSENCKIALSKTTYLLTTAYSNGTLTQALKYSPGLSIYLWRILEDQGLFLDEIEEYRIQLLETIRGEIKGINFSIIAERHLNFYILNCMELKLAPAIAAAPKGNDALSFIARAYLRFEKGDYLLGILPIAPDLRSIITRIETNVATKNDIEKIERLLLSQQEEFQRTLRLNMNAIKAELQLEQRIGSTKSTRFWDILGKISTAVGVIDFAGYINDLFQFLNENKQVFPIALTLILKMAGGP